MADRPRTFAEVVAAESPEERARWERAESYRDPAVVGDFHAARSPIGPAVMPSGPWPSRSATPCVLRAVIFEAIGGPLDNEMGRMINHSSSERNRGTAGSLSPKPPGINPGRLLAGDEVLGTLSSQFEFNRQWPDATRAPLADVRS
jgi:hypothetical protein